ncbi:MAG: hypothetical protein VKP70_05435 [Cyanobacteriota bacterium]|nr:hypothetical protein [Cyanobacteriota bacterium]
MGTGSNTTGVLDVAIRCPTAEVGATIRHGATGEGKKSPPEGGREVIDGRPGLKRER